MDCNECISINMCRCISCSNNINKKCKICKILFNSVCNYYTKINWVDKIKHKKTLKEIEKIKRDYNDKIKTQKML